MAIVNIDHANIRTTDVAGTVAFFRDVLGMEASPTPGSSTLDNGAWMLDAGGRAAIHIGGMNATYPSDGWRPPVTEARTDSGRLHHVALSCAGFAEMRERVFATGLDVAEFTIESIGLRQLFVTEPNGVMLELNFWGD